MIKLVWSPNFGQPNDKERRKHFIMKGIRMKQHHGESNKIDHNQTEQGA